jgi:signal transduction histidine kinase
MQLNPPFAQMRIVQRNTSARVSMFAWLLCSITVIQTLLVRHIITIQGFGLQAITVQALQIIAAVGAIGLLLYVAAHTRTRRRRLTWLLYATSVLTSLAGNLIQLTDTQNQVLIQVANPLLCLATYLIALVGTALYVPWRQEWVGSIQRTLINSTAISLATLSMLHSLLPQESNLWTSPVGTQIIAIAMDMGILFSISVIGVRAERKSAWFVVLMFLGTSSLLLGDVVFTAIVVKSHSNLWGVVAGPLYTLHWALLAFGASRSVARSIDTPQAVAVVPSGEWVLWTAVPRLWMIGAFIAAARGVIPSPLMVAALIISSAAREAFDTHEYRRVLRTKQAAYDALLSATRQIEHFVGGIIHDIGAPIHGVQCAAEALQVPEADPESRRLLGLMRQQLGHLGYLIGQLRVYQQIRTLHLDLETLDIAPICATALGAIQDQADQRGVLLRLSLAHDDAHAQVDIGALRRVLDNLLTNALQATEPGGTIEVLVGLAGASNSGAAEARQLKAPDAEKRHADMIVIRIRDTGCGMTLDQQELAFDPLVHFRRGGTGMGLAITHDLVKAMHGTIQVVSSVGDGSTFWLQLPRAMETNRPQ